MAQVDGVAALTLESRLAEALALLQSRLARRVQACEPLEGGLTNHSWRLQTDSGPIVLRLSGGRERELGIDRVSELAALEAAAQAGLGPRVLLAEPDWGILVTTAAAGGPWSPADAVEPRNLLRIARWFAALHALATPAGLHSLSMRQGLADLALALARSGIDPVPERLYELADRQCQRLDDLAERAFCHNDAHHLNVIDDGSALVVVDWEYAAVAEAVVDLAEYAVAHGLDAQRSAALLGHYRDAGGNADTPVFEAACWLAAFRALLWIEARQAADPALGTSLAARRSVLLAQLDAAG